MASRAFSAAIFSSTAGSHYSGDRFLRQTVAFRRGTAHEANRRSENQGHASDASTRSSIDATIRSFSLRRDVSQRRSALALCEQVSRASVTRNANREKAPLDRPAALTHLATASRVGQANSGPARRSRHTSRNNQKCTASRSMIRWLAWLAATKPLLFRFSLANQLRDGA